MSNQARNFFRGQSNGISIVHTPINPFVIIKVRQQMQNRSFDIFRGFDICRSFRCCAAKILVRDPEDKRVIWPHLFILQDHMLPDRSIPIPRQNNRVDLFFRFNHSRPPGMLFSGPIGRMDSMHVYFRIPLSIMPSIASRFLLDQVPDLSC